MLEGKATTVDGRFLTTALNDPTKQSQIYEYVEALKGDENGWKKSIENIVTNDLRSAEECFIMLQVVEDYVNTRYAMSDEPSTIIIKQFLSHLLLKNGEEDIPSFLVNKMAQIFALVFAVDFPVRWPKFIQEVFLSSGMDDTRAIQFYLKTLLAIDSEVVDRDIQRASHVFDRNTKIKDAMRDVCMIDCVRSWYHILKEMSDISTQSLVLDVIAIYVDWIDIELVANEELVPLLIDRLAHSCTTQAAQRAVCGIIGKKMPSLKKIPLVLAIAKVINEHKLLEISEESGEEDELRAANLLSAIGLAVIESYTKTEKESLSEEEKQGTLTGMKILEKEVKTMLQLLGSDNEDVSMSMMEFVKNYIGLIMQNPSREGDRILMNIMEVVLKRYEMDEDVDMDGTGEEQSDFHEYRKELRHVMHAITLKRPELIVEPLEVRMREMKEKGVGLKKTEATLHLVYSLSELLPNGLLNAKGGWLERGGRLPLAALSILSPHSPSTTLTLLYFEIVSRYERLMCRDSAVIISLVPHFISDYGLGNNNPTVRSRVIYLFSRFVKSQKTLLAAAVPEVIMRVAPLVSSQDDLSSSLLSHQDHGYLLEATATLIVFSDIEASVKAQYMAELASTIGNRFKKQLEWMGDMESRGQLDGKAKHFLEESLPANVSYTIKLTKAFGLSGKEKNMKECGCAGIFIELLNLFTCSLSFSRSFLAESTRQLAGRLVLCLEDELFPSLSLLLSSLSSLAIDADSMLHLLILTNNIVQKHKGGLLSSSIDISSILEASFRLATESNPQLLNDHTGRSLMYLKRSFLTLVLSLLTTELFERIVDADVGSRLFQLARLLSRDSDSTTQKTAVTVLSRMIVGGGDEVMEQVLSTLLSLPLTPNFSFKDAASQLVLHEVRCTIHDCFVQRPILVTSLISSNFPGDFSEQMLSSLSTLSGKDADRTFTMLYTQLRNS